MTLINKYNRVAMVLKAYSANGPCLGRSSCEGQGAGDGKDSEVNCRDCSLDPLCALLDYANGSSETPEGILLRQRPIARGESIFRLADPFHSVFAVKSGSFKTLLPGPSGEEQVIGFHLPGEMIGAAGVAEGAYPCTARALEPSSICELRMERLEESGKSTEVLQRAIIELLGREVAFNSALLASLVRQSAEQRIGAFLLNISQRLQTRGKVGQEFVLSMSRSDIGSYLGLASETVSRVLTRFQKAGVLSLNRKRVELLDPDYLAGVAGEVGRSAT